MRHYLWLAITLAFIPACNPELGSTEGKQCNPEKECIASDVCNHATNICVSFICEEIGQTLPCGENQIRICSKEVDDSLMWGNCETEGPCDTTDCGRGTCNDTTGNAVCTCNEGWNPVDNCSSCANGYHDESGACVLDANCTANSCNNHGTCDDSSGVVSCSCSTEYIGATCEACASGYQDLDSDGECLATCSTANLNCSNHGTCDDSSGTSLCVCEEGYDGSSCDTCANGYHLDGISCVIDEACTANSCNNHGTCDDSSGVISCSCSTEYIGATCEACASGYQDLDSDGECLATCSTANLNCSGNGACSDVSGTALCVCNAGYAGNQCDVCANGYHVDGTSCVIDQTCTANSCNNHGTCDDSSGVVSCSCSTEYVGTTCASCAFGYQDNDGDGQCTANCSVAPPNCNSHGTCSDSSGTPLCVCSTGWDPLNDCATCAAGYHTEGVDCVIDETCAAASCNFRGTCDDTSGAIQCTCNIEYTGDTCDTCDTGYQDADGNTDCEPTCATSALNCNSHGMCSHMSGSPVCVCDTRYTGMTCEQCQPDYFNWPTCSPFLSTVSATLSTGQTTEMNFGNGGYILLKHALSADSTGNTATVRLAYRIQLSGVQASSFILFRNGSTQLTGGGIQVAKLTPIVVVPDQEIIVVVAFYVEEMTIQGTSNEYHLNANITGLDTGDSVTVTLLTDDTPTSTLNGARFGYVWNSTVSEDMLFMGQLGLNQSATPWFVWSGMKDISGYTYPNIGSGGNILTSGSAHFSDSYEIRSQLSGIQNTATKTN